MPRPTAMQSKSAIGAVNILSNQFVEVGSLPATDDSRHAPPAVADGEPVMAFAFDLGNVGRIPSGDKSSSPMTKSSPSSISARSCFLFGLATATTTGQVLQDSCTSYPQLLARCEEFDHEFDGRPDQGRR